MIYFIVFFIVVICLWHIFYITDKLMKDLKRIERIDHAGKNLYIK